MNDSYNRYIDYLRISITDRCNLRCLYCMPEEGICRLQHSEVLRYEEITDVVKAAAAAGVKKIRITGGEPLVRSGVSELVEMIKAIDGIDNIAMTTNGILLAENASRLAAAGLDRLNISLDTLSAAKFREITRGGDINRVFEGIDAAESAGLLPIKINTVIIRGFNDHEVIPLSEWAFSNHLNLRFIEFMPVTAGSFSFDDKFISLDDIRTRIFFEYPDLKQCSIQGSGPAENWSRDGLPGSIGFIEAVSHSFCSKCNRIRLTADGRLKPCLFSNEEVDLVPVLRGESDGRLVRLENLVRSAVLMKPASHGNFSGVTDNSRCMNEIGG